MLRAQSWRRRQPPITVRDGVYAPQDDTELLRDALLDERRLAGASLLELCCGSGVLSVEAAAAGASVDAVDVSPRAVRNTMLNAAVNGLRVAPHVGDLFEPVGDRRFDFIVANPPYVPAAEEARAEAGARHWHGGPDGREIVDQICRRIARHLHPGGIGLIVHSSLADVGETIRRLQRTGLEATVACSKRIPLGPVSLSQLRHLRRRGYCDDDRSERIAVVRAIRS